MTETEVKIERTRDAFKLFEDKLKEAMSLLAERDQIGVERLPQLDGYNLTHPRGIFGLLFNGDDYIKRDDIGGDSIIMKRDLIIGVVAIIRFIDNGLNSVDRYGMMPVDYVELASDALSGIKIFNKRPRNESKVYPGKTVLVDEERGIWKYLTPFYVPIDFVEKSLRETY